jgi:hypothetical protein
MVVSAHFIASDWTLKDRFVSFKELPTPHTGVTIGDQLLSTMADWKITDKSNSSGPGGNSHEFRRPRPHVTEVAGQFQ